MKRGLGYAFWVFVIDQSSKFYIAWFALEKGEVMKVTPFLNLINVRNRGISFSFFHSDSSWVHYTLIALISAIIVWLLAWLYREKDGLVVLALGLIIGGALGNLSDRFTYGGVVDFIDFHIAGWHWPAFNAADSFICIGALLLAWRTVLTPFKVAKRSSP